MKIKLNTLLKGLIWELLGMMIIGVYGFYLTGSYQISGMLIIYPVVRVFLWYPYERIFKWIRRRQFMKTPMGKAYYSELKRRKKENDKVD